MHLMGFEGEEGDTDLDSDNLSDEYDSDEDLSFHSDYDYST